MAAQQVVTFDITPDQITELTSGGTGITITINYYDDAPAGYEIVASSTSSASDAGNSSNSGVNNIMELQGANNNELTLCAKPCNKFTFPGQQ